MSSIYVLFNIKDFKVLKFFKKALHDIEKLIKFRNVINCRRLYSLIETKLIDLCGSGCMEEVVRNYFVNNEKIPVYCSTVDKADSCYEQLQNHISSLLKLRTKTGASIMLLRGILDDNLSFEKIKPRAQRPLQVEDKNSENDDKSFLSNRTSEPHI